MEVVYAGKPSRRRASSLAAFPKEAPEHFFAGTSEGLLRLPADALPETR